MQRLLFFLPIVCGCFAGQLLVLPAGTVGTSPIGGTHNGDYRIEGRLLGCQSTGANQVIFQGGVFDLALSASGTLTARMWGTTAQGGWPAVNVGGIQDYVFRAQKSPSSGKSWLEVWNMETGARLHSEKSMTVSVPRDRAATLGGPAITGADGKCRIGFLRVYDSVVPLNGTLPATSKETGAILDLSFDGDAKDASGKRRDMSFSGSKPAYEPEPMYPPVCHAGQTNTFRAGAAMQLDSSRSFALDGGALTAQWRVVRKPATASLHFNAGERQPKVTGAVAGDYVFQLAVTDQSGNQSVCFVNHGAVATDPRGVVITGNPDVDTILGPLIMWSDDEQSSRDRGNLPYPWMNERHQYLSAYFGSFQGVDWSRGAWAAGSVTATRGSRLVTGSGTRFLADICRGGYLPDQGGYLAVIDSASGAEGRWFAPVRQCLSDTKLELAVAWPHETMAGKRYHRMTSNVAGWRSGPLAGTLTLTNGQRMVTGSETKLLAQGVCSGRIYPISRIEVSASGMATVTFEGPHDLKTDSNAYPDFQVRGVTSQPLLNGDWDIVATPSATQVTFTISGVAPGEYTKTTDPAIVARSSGYKAAPLLVWDGDGKYLVRVSHCLSREQLVLNEPWGRPTVTRAAFSKPGNAHYARWEDDLEGTVTFIFGSREVSGTGTKFQRDYCNGDSIPEQSTYPVLRSPLPGLPAGKLGYTLERTGTGIAYNIVVACPSDTKLILARAWGFDTPHNKGAPHSLLLGDDISAWHTNNGTNINYYDNALAHYSLHFRSGLDKPKVYADWVADKWLTYPYVNYGYKGVSYAQPGSALDARELSTTGLYLRGLTAESSLHLESAFRQNTDTRTQLGAYTWALGERETGYKLAFASLCALFDKTNQNTCKTTIVNSITRVNGWKQMLRPHGAYEVPYGGAHNGGKATVVVQPDKRTLIGANSNFTRKFGLWLCGLPCNSNMDGDKRTYHAYTIDSPTRITLQEDYTGAIDGKPRQIWFGASAGIPQIGWGTQPFFMGIIGIGMHWAHKALEDYAPAAKGVCDSTLTCSQWLKQTRDGLGAWMLKYGYRSGPNNDESVKGLFYMVHCPSCNLPDGAPAPEQVPPERGCAGSAGAARGLVPEVTRLMTEVYLDKAASSAADAAEFQAATEKMMNAAWLKPGTERTQGPRSDGKYWAYNMEAGLDYRSGKWLGFPLGMGFSPAWPAAELLNRFPRPKQPVALNVTFDLARIQGATQTKVYLTEPTGRELPPVRCASSPCEITAPDRDAGQYLIRIDYWSDTALLSGGNAAPLQIPARSVSESAGSEPRK